jgi:hypothetical protein
MTSRIAAVFLTAALAGNSIGQARPSGRLSVQEQVRALHEGQPVEVRFVDGSKLRGWIGEVSDSGFVLRQEGSQRRLTSSPVAFAQVSSVKQVKSVKSSHTLRNILIGMGLAGIVIGAVFGIYVTTHGLG